MDHGKEEVEEGMDKLRQAPPPLSPLIDTGEE